MHVHDLVDYVSDEAELAGHSATAYIQNEVNITDSIAVQAGEGIRYILPQMLHIRKEQDVTFFMRVAAPTGKVRISLWCKDSCLASQVRIRTAPGEMEKLTLKKEMMEKIDGPITAKLEEMA